MKTNPIKTIITLYKKYKLLRWFWWISFIIPTLGFIFITIGFVIYAHWPRDYSSISALNIENSSEYITLSAHGVKDDKTSWSDELQSVMTTTKPPQLTNVISQHISLNWQPHSNNLFTCSVSGKNLGNEIGRLLASKTKIKGLHLVGHSCGAFVILGICQQLKTLNSIVVVQTTFLDPVSVYSGFFWQYGLDHFGSCADFSDSYIDTGDTVPGSNQNLPHSMTFDVTQARIKSKRKVVPHAWPTQYYIEAYKKQSVPVYFNSPVKFAPSSSQKMINLDEKSHK